MNHRYERQIAFPGIGPEGQEKLCGASVAIIGCGALGSSSANILARAGVGFLRLIDPELVSLSNLQRQQLYTEADIGQPKVKALTKRLQSVNAEVKVEPWVDRANSVSLAGMLHGIDLVLDGTDSMSSRVDINNACREAGIPWIYGGVQGSVGMTMNFLPGGPCFCCVFGEDVARRKHNSKDASGVLSMITGVISSLQCTEAVKILVGAPDIRHELLTVDVWKNTIRKDAIPPQQRCRACRSAMEAAATSSCV